MYNSRKLRSFAGLIALVVFVLTLNVSAFAQFQSSAGSAVLMEASTGQILYEKNADTAVPPASITKVMTLLLGLEAVEQGKVKWDDLVTISEKSWRMGGSKMFLLVGDKVKYSDIMTGISVVSANDGCVALAEHLYGSEEAFVQVMNQRARELGMVNSQFKNSSGLPAPGHVMSAKDIAILARHIIQNHPKIIELESQREFTYNNIRQFNRNPLLGVFPGADGLKTGWTEEAGYCLAGTAQQNGMRLISVVLNTKDEKERSTASQELLTYGFRNFKSVKLKNAGEIAGNIEVKNGKKQSVPIKIDSDISVIIPAARENDIKTEIIKDSSALNAPVTAGSPVGKLEVQLDGKTLASTSISTAEDAAGIGIFGLILRGIGNIFKLFTNS
ncbi:MAG: D-alanyl-D-alanine carboxypeptidase family protein [Bacillota bacterium]